MIYLVNLPFSMAFVGLQVQVGAVSGNELFVLFRFKPSQDNLIGKKMKKIYSAADVDISERHT